MGKYKIEIKEMNLAKMRELLQFLVNQLDLEIKEIDIPNNLKKQFKKIK